MPALGQYKDPLNAIFIEYIPGMQMLDIGTYSKARMEKFIDGLKIIHNAHVLHDDPRPRNMMIVTAQGKAEERPMERVMWLDFDHAKTYREPLSKEEEICIAEEDLIIEQLGPLLVCIVFALSPSTNIFLIETRNMTVLSAPMIFQACTFIPEY